MTSINWVTIPYPMNISTADVRFKYFTIMELNLSPSGVIKSTMSFGLIPVLKFECPYFLQLMSYF